MRQPFPQPLEDPVKAVGISVVEKVNLHLIARRAKCVGDQLWPESRPSDSNDQDALEWLPARGRDAPNVDIGGEFQNAFVGLYDVGAQFVVRRELRSAKPIMADHAI